MKRATSFAVGLVLFATSFTLAGCIGDEPSDESVLEDEIYRGRGEDRGKKCGWWKHGHHGQGGGAGGMAGVGGSGGAAGTTGVAGTTGAGGTGGSGPNCPLPPRDIVSWWHLDGDHQDAVGANDGTSGGSAAFGTGLRGSGLSLSGAEGAYMEVPDAPDLRIAGPITIDAWINPTVAGGRIVDKIAAGTANGFLLDLTRDQLRMVAGGDVVVSAPGSVLTGEWTHVAGMFSGSALALYVNGVLVASKSTAGNPTPTAAGPLRVGADASGGSRFTGMIDEPRIFNRGLSADEIATIFQQGLAPPCP